MRFVTALLTFWLIAFPAAADQKSPILVTLFDRLRSATSEAEALSVERDIWRVWVRHEREDVNSRMARGIILMNAGKFEQSLDIFTRLVDMAPDHAEAWNKRATVFYLIGDLESSVRDIQKTLALEPRHFGALSGMSLIYAELGQERAALQLLERALEIHPLMQGARQRVDELREKLKGNPI